jgi:hypothetical protein
MGGRAGRLVLCHDTPGCHTSAWTSETGAEVGLSAVVRFSPDLMLQHASWDSAFDRRHQELEKAGRLDHPLDRCRDRGRPPWVREWTTEAGWRDMTPAPIPVEAR